MATSIAADRLNEWADKLEQDIERQQSKGGNCITICAEDVSELVFALREGFADIDGFVNGSI